MQVAMILRDMDAAMKRHWEVLKIGPWDLHNSMPARFRVYVGSLRPSPCHRNPFEKWLGRTCHASHFSFDGERHALQGR
jgi:hypothetical protein